MRQLNVRCVLEYKSVVLFETIVFLSFEKTKFNKMMTKKISVLQKQIGETKVCKLHLHIITL